MPATAPLSATAWLRSIPGLGPTLTAIILAELGDITWFTKFSQLRQLAGLDIIRVQSGQWAGTARISRCGRPLLRWALYQAALGACRTRSGGRTGDPPRQAPGRPACLFQDERGAGGKAPPGDLDWSVWRSGRPYTGGRASAAAA
jgi:transposase